MWLNYTTTVKHYFCRILISRFPYVENSLHFNFADFPVNFIKQFVSRFFWCLKQMLLSKFVLYYCLHYIIPRILHIILWKSWYSMQINSWWWAIPKICMYLISQFYSSCENRTNLMLAKYTCLTVHNLYCFYCVIYASVCHHGWIISTCYWYCSQAVVHLSACVCQSERWTLSTQTYPVV